MPSNAKERLYEDLKRRVVTLELEPGLPLDETSLSREYGVSRTPLREVFRRLAGEGYLEIRSNRGAIVAPMDHRHLRAFFTAAPMIYAAVARLAAQNAQPAQIAELRSTQAKFRKAVAAGNVEGMITWNDRFHWIIGQMSANPYLLPSLQRLLIDHARIGQTFWRAGPSDLGNNIATAADHHDRFIALIEAGDAEGVVKLTLEHWALSREHIEMFVHPDPLPLDVIGTD
ncbi:GntR family transcriptional regulator [Maritimibacter sp. 55A14]|uniref:GntR family transcriptional regulator n=1 Tax=Maritimibacter sp. 55A14 TaxID=2174844 RepID=UPI000D61FC6D|nr:GntR family transcriptional regulator [Maritimibacter sp. 55A14]PWE33778.1 GntR family transcriptional regulator [Maritimibacter sp. 55A14]